MKSSCLGRLLLFGLLACCAPAQAQPIPPGFNPFLLPPLPPDAPKPSPDPRNLEGAWYHQDMMEVFLTKTMHGDPVPMNDKAKALLRERAVADKSGHPLANAAVRCRPPGPIWQRDINFPFAVLQIPDEIDFLFEEFHGVWKIRMNQPHRPSGRREYMGDSVGHWEGDTLVVDTTNFKDVFWVNSDLTGAPLSRDAHLVDRIRKIDDDGPALSVVTTIDDPAYFTSQWSISRKFIWRPDRAIFAEYDCEDDVGRPDGVSRYGFSDAPGPGEN
jgi:hypothetical protein